MLKVTMLKGIILSLSAPFIALSTLAQTTGDYRTATTNTAWHNAGDWQTWSGTAWITASAIPGATNNVYVQSGHNLSLAGNQSCNNLFISTGTTSATTGANAQVNLGSNTLSLNGKLSCYFGAVDITPNSNAALAVTASTAIPSTPITITPNSAGKISVVGNSRNLTETGAWSASNTASSSTFAIEINLNTGETATMQTAIKASAWQITSGTLNAGSNVISADKGTDGEGDITIAVGATLQSAQSSMGSPVFQRTSTTRAGTLTVNGTLVLTGATPYIQMNAVNLNGTVSYTGTSSTQTLAQAPVTAAAINNYNHLSLSGGTTKALPTSITVNGNLQISAPATGSLTIDGNSHTLTLGGNYTHIINGTGTIAYQNGDEFHLSLSGTGSQILSLGSAPLNVRNLNIAATSLPVLNDAGSTIAVHGDLTNNGSVSGNGKLQLSGSVAQSISGTGTVANLELNNPIGATILSGNNHLNLTGLLTISAGTLTTNNNLTLKSGGASQAAMVGPMPATGAAIVGQVKHERYLSAPANGSAGRSWRLLTTPLKGNINNSVFYNWQNNGLIDNTGLEIWAPGGTGSAGDGLASGPATSLRSYNPLTNAYVGVTNTQTENLFDASGNKPFLAFVSGPYGSGNIASGAATTNLDATGELITGTQNYSFTAPNASNIYYLIGNPYACPIDFDDVWNNSGTTNINRKFWVIDPSLGNIGAYVTVTHDNGSYITSVGSQNRYLQTGQAFFVEATIPNQPSTVTIEENDKETNAPQTPMFRTNGGTLETIRLQLSRIGSQNTILLDGTVAACHQQNTNSVTAADAVKFNNFNETIAIKKGNQNLAIESRQLYDIGDTLQLTLSGLQQTNYLLEIQANNINAPYLQATLYDAFLNTAIPISLTNDTSYNFSVTGNPAAAATERFFIVFSGTNPLSNVQIDLHGEQQQDATLLKWRIMDEMHISSYEIERSSDGRQFYKIGTIPADGSENYSYKDAEPIVDVVYYRIFCRTRSSSGACSKVIRMAAPAEAPKMYVLNSKSIDNQLHVRIENTDPGSYSLSLIAANGQLMQQQALSVPTHRQLNATMEVQVLSSGLYFLRLQNQKGEQITEFRFLKQ